MTATPESATSERSLGAIVLSPSVRRHLLILGVSMFATGTTALWLLPDLSLRRVAGAVFVFTHVGLLVAIGGAVLRWAAKHRTGV